jgi:hypothetical protein
MPLATPSQSNCVDRKILPLAGSPPDLATTDRASHNASLTLGLTLPTDTVLYLLLPLYPELFGVTLAEAGLLLAANRIIRIAGYRWVAGPMSATDRVPRASPR